MICFVVCPGGTWFVCCMSGGTDGLFVVCQEVSMVCLGMSGGTWFVCCMSGGTWFGVDINNETIADNYIACVWEPWGGQDQRVTAARRPAASSCPWTRRSRIPSPAGMEVGRQWDAAVADLCRVVAADRLPYRR